VGVGPGLPGGLLRGGRIRSDARRGPGCLCERAPAHDRDWRVVGGGHPRGPFRSHERDARDGEREHGVLVRVRVAARHAAGARRGGRTPLQRHGARRFAHLLDGDHRGGGARVPRGARAAIAHGYGAGAVAPLAFGAILDWYGARTAGAWGWAFVSLGIAGAGAVASVLALQATPEAAILRRDLGRRQQISVSAR